ncbi:MAG: F0F1 ATP synthase subunit delta [Alphaproteobacteria bacterium]|nr:F0F1 ATP synthase subunit delta [Alphaproteobacteria bacterium]
MATDDLNLSSMPGRYAGALFELADGRKQAADVEKDLSAFQALLDESEDLRRLVASPVFTAEDQDRALKTLSDKAGLSELTSNFLRVIARNRRLFALPQMISAYKSLAARSRDEVTAEVTTAQPLSDEQAAELKKTLTASVGKTVMLDARVDPSILGGLIVKVGSRMVDSSLRTKLTAIRMGLKGAA